MKIRTIVPAILLGLVLAFFISGVHPQVAHAQTTCRDAAGVPIPCPEPEKEKKKTPIPPRPTQTPTHRPTLTPTSTKPPQSSGLGGIPPIPTDSGMVATTDYPPIGGMPAWLGPFVGLFAIGSLLIFLIGLFIGGGVWLKGSIFQGSKPGTDMSDPNTKFELYTGHSNLGGNVLGGLESGPHEQAGGDGSQPLAEYEEIAHADAWSPPPEGNHLLDTEFGIPDSDAHAKQNSFMGDSSAEPREESVFEKHDPTPRLNQVIGDPGLAQPPDPNTPVGGSDSLDPSPHLNQGIDNPNIKPPDVGVDNPDI